MPGTNINESQIQESKLSNLRGLRLGFWDMGLGLGFAGYRFGIGFLGYRFGIGFGFGIWVWGQTSYQEYVDRVVHIWTFQQEYVDRTVRIWSFFKNLWTLKSIYDLLRGKLIEDFEKLNFYENSKICKWSYLQVPCVENRKTGNNRK